MLGQCLAGMIDAELMDVRVPQDDTMVVLRVPQDDTKVVSFSPEYRIPKNPTAETCLIAYVTGSTGTQTVNVSPDRFRAWFWRPRRIARRFARITGRFPGHRSPAGSGRP